MEDSILNRVILFFWWLDREFHVVTKAVYLCLSGLVDFDL